MLSFGIFITTASLFSQIAPKNQNSVSSAILEIKYDLLLEEKNIGDLLLVNSFLKENRLPEVGSFINLFSETGIAISSDGYILTSGHRLALTYDKITERKKVILQEFKQDLDSSSTVRRYSKEELNRIADELPNLVDLAPVTLHVLVGGKETRGARIVANDPEFDLALLKSDFLNLGFLNWGDSSQLRVGDKVAILGYSRASEMQGFVEIGATTDRKGIVSALAGQRFAVRQTTNADGGESGSPVTDDQGDVVGICTDEPAKEGQSRSAISSNTVLQFLREKGVTPGGIKAQNPEAKNQASETLAPKEGNDKGTLIFHGFTPGTSINLKPGGDYIFPVEGDLKITDVPFGAIQVTANIPVYEKVYQTQSYYTQKAVIVSGFPPGQKIILDKAAQVTVPASGIVAIPNLNGKPRAFHEVSGWGTGFETNILVSDNKPYAVTFDSGNLTVSNLPPHGGVLLNGIASGIADENGNWTGINLPTGRYVVALKAKFFVSPEKQTEVSSSESNQVAMEPRPAGELNVVTLQAGERVDVAVFDADGKEVVLDQLASANLGSGKYSVKARLKGDPEYTYTADETIEAGKSFWLYIPKLEFSRSYLDQREKVKTKEFYDKLFYFGARIGTTSSFNFIVGINAWDWDFKTGVFFTPYGQDYWYNLSQSVGYWFLKYEDFKVGAGGQISYIYVGPTMNSFNDSTSNVLFVDPELMCKIFGFSFDIGYGGYLLNHLMESSEPLYYTICLQLGWYWNY
jgi:S1-C subfamily serine protease